MFLLNPTLDTHEIRKREKFKVNKARPIKSPPSHIYSGDSMTTTRNSAIFKRQKTKLSRPEVAWVGVGQQRARGGRNRRLGWSRTRGMGKTRRLREQEAEGAGAGD